MEYSEEELIYNIAKKLNLSYFDYQQMISDVKDGRGDEWLDTVIRSKNEKLVKSFKRIFV